MASGNPTLHSPGISSGVWGPRIHYTCHPTSPNPYPTHPAEGDCDDGEVGLLMDSFPMIQRCALGQQEQQVGYIWSFSTLGEMVALWSTPHTWDAETHGYLNLISIKYDA